VKFTQQDGLFVDLPDSCPASLLISREQRDDFPSTPIRAYRHSLSSSAIFASHVYFALWCLNSTAATTGDRGFDWYYWDKICGAVGL
jgi:hypothetical protein